jgi:hypothetical protein
MYALTFRVLLCIALAAAATAFWLTAVNPCVAAGQVPARGRALVIRPEHRVCGGSRWGLHLQESATPHISYRMLHVAISRQLRLPGSVGRSYPALVRRPGCCQARCDTVPLPELQLTAMLCQACVAAACVWQQNAWRYTYHARCRKRTGTAPATMSQASSLRYYLLSLRAERGNQLHMLGSHQGICYERIGACLQSLMEMHIQTCRQSHPVPRSLHGRPGNSRLRVSQASISLAGCNERLTGIGKHPPRTAHLMAHNNWQTEVFIPWSMYIEA